MQNGDENSPFNHNNRDNLIRLESSEDTNQTVVVILVRKKSTYQMKIGSVDSLDVDGLKN
jgi:hypothetical protein